MEPAVEVFSACLPTMTPLAHTRIHLKSLTSALRSLVSSRRSSPGQSHNDTESHPPTLRPDRLEGIFTHAATKPSFERDTDSDEIPLRSIKVQRDVQWEEMRR